MSITTLLIIIAAGCFLILLVKFFRQVQRIRQGNREISRGSVTLNWVLVLGLVVSVVGAIYSGVNHQASRPAHQKTVQSAKSKTSTPSQPLRLSFTDDVTLDANAQARIKITVSRGSKVTIEGRNTGTTYARFNAGKGRGTVKKTVTLNSAGPYRVIAKRGHRTLAKNLTVRASQTTANTSSIANRAQSSQTSAAFNSTAGQNGSSVSQAASAGTANSAAASAGVGNGSADQTVGNQ